MLAVKFAVLAVVKTLLVHLFGADDPDSGVVFLCESHVCQFKLTTVPYCKLRSFYTALLKLGYHRPHHLMAGTKALSCHRVYLKADSFAGFNKLPPGFFQLFLSCQFEHGAGYHVIYLLLHNEVILH